jgi:acylphosphatase
MTEVATLAFELYLMACCLFAPADKMAFEIELREGQRANGIVMYVERADSGFMIYGDKEKKGEALPVKKVGERYVVAKEGGGKKTGIVIDNAKAGITPLEKDGKYVREIDGKRVTFELKEGTRKVYQDLNDKTFTVRSGDQPQAGRDGKPASQLGGTNVLRRVHVFVSGKVQNVGFRDFVRSKARTLKLKGWVKNLPDKRVELVAEGPSAQIDELLKAVAKGPSAARVSTVEPAEEPYSGEFKEFEIMGNDD